MNNRLLLFMTILVLVAMAALLSLNLLPFFSSSRLEKYIAYNDVRGMAIEHHNLLYTLNFDQQNKFIDYINGSIPIGSGAAKKDAASLDFTKIVIYRFGAADLVLTPEGYDQGNLVYFVKEWNPNGYLKDVSRGSWKELISQTYDH